jgi:hypothetical protein
MKIRVDELMTHLHNMPLHAYIEVVDLNPIVYFKKGNLGYEPTTPFADAALAKMNDILFAAINTKRPVMEKNSKGNWQKWE